MGGGGGVDDGLKIRLATVADAEELSRIYAYYVENFPYSFEYEAPSAQTFVERIEDVLRFYPYFVCEEAAGGEILGFAYAHAYHERKAYQWVCETSIYVRHDTRRGGVGRALYGRLLPALQKQGFTKAFAILGCPNPASEAFHARMGFQLLATFPDMGYKLGAWHDVRYYVYEFNRAAPGMREPVAYAGP